MTSSSGATRYFSVAHAAAFSRLTLTMVDYLCRIRVVVPSHGRKRGRGIQRLFSFGDIVVLRAVAKLLEGGVSVYRLRTALRALRASHPTITSVGMPAAYLVTDGKDVLLRHKSGVFELLKNGQFSFAFVVEMESVRKEAVAFARTHSDTQVALDGRRRA